MEDRPATMAEAANEYVWNVGRARPDVEWICSPYDTYHKNPFYEGEPGPHPDDPPHDWLMDEI